MMINWEKKGRIYCPTGEGFFKSHATRPIPYLLETGVLRLYFSSRSDEDMPYPAFIDIDLADSMKVIAVADKPLMPLGRPGTFDDSGITPVSILRRAGEDRMYYVGWKRRRCVSIEASIGLAILRHQGETLERAFEGPILAQDINHPLMTAAPFVMFDEGRYKMWYCSGTDWRFPDGNPEPIYTVFYAESDDGITWNPRPGPVINYKYDGEVISAPWVEKVGDKYLMWYSTRGHQTREAKQYTIGFAESADGINWQRRDEQPGIARSPSGWDSEMICYPALYAHRDLTYMFYSGNGVGRGGLGYAVADNFLS
jgi:predicted GH43/DUF377 family glycosyl hydrolase